MAFTDALTKRLALVLTGESSGAIKALRDTAREVDAANKKFERINKVEIKPPTSGLGRWVDDLRAQGGVAGKTLDQLGVSGTNAGAALQAGLLKGALAGGAALAFLAAKSVGAASALEEQANRAVVVFGKQSAAVRGFARDAGVSFGLSERAALQAASSFAVILEATGKSGEGIASMSVQLTKLASDLASFNNISTADAIQKVTAGLAGEAEPLRRVGVFLTEAKVQAEAYASGIAAAGAKLTEGQKIQARYNIILKETAQAQGDAERTSGSFANQQRQLVAQMENLAAAVGELVIPVFTEAIKVLNGMVSPLVTVAQKANDLKNVFGGLKLPSWLSKPVKVAIEYANPLVQNPIGLPLKAADELGDRFTAAFGKADQAVQITEKTINSLVRMLNTGGDAAEAFWRELERDPSKATAIFAIADKVPEFKLALDASAAAIVNQGQAAQRAAGWFDNYNQRLTANIDAVRRMAAATEELPRALRDAEAAVRAYDEAQRALANVSAEVRLAEIARIEQAQQLQEQQARIAQAEQGVAQARRALTAATDAQREAESNYTEALTAQASARQAAIDAEAEFLRVAQGAGAASREYAEATEQVGRASTGVQRALLSERDAVAAVADAQRNLANAKQFAAQSYALELAQARLSAQQAQQSYQSLVVSLAAVALASGQAAAAQQLLSSEFLDSAAGAQAAAQAALLQAEASLRAVQAQQSLASAQQSVTDAQNSYRAAQQRVQDATRDLNDALEEQRRVLQGYGADSREAADALRDLQNAQLDARSAALDVADAQDRVTEAQARVAQAAQSGNANELIRARRELERAQIDLERAQDRLLTARQNAGTAQSDYQGTVSGFDPNSQQAQTAAANVATAQAAVVTANQGVDASYRALQNAVQNLAIVQAQQAIDAQRAQIAMQQQVQSTTSSIESQAVALQQANLALAQIASDPGRPYREIDAAARAAEGAQLDLATAAYGLRDAQSELNTRLQEQQGWLSGFSAGSPQYKAAYDRMRDAAGEYASKQKAANDALKGLNDARSATADARAALVASMANLKATTRDVALQTEKIRLQMQLSDSPSRIYKQRLDDVKDAAFRLKDQQTKVRDLTSTITGLMGQTGPVHGYRGAFRDLNQTLAYTVAYLQFISQKLSGLGGVPTAPSSAPRSATPRADGGGVNAGDTYLVGERGPELFVSKKSGTIIPNGGFGGSSVTIERGAISVQAAPGQNAAQIADEVFRRLRRELAGR